MSEGSKIAVIVTIISFVSFVTLYAGLYRGVSGIMHGDLNASQDTSNLFERQAYGELRDHVIAIIVTISLAVVGFIVFLIKPFQRS